MKDKMLEMVEHRMEMLLRKKAKRYVSREEFTVAMAELKAIKIQIEIMEG